MEKVEGTVMLDGLVEGRLPQEPGAEGKLREWVSFAGSLGLRFSLEVDGPQWSLLADNRPFRAEALRGSPSQLIGDALRELLKVFPAPERPRLFSTLRSIEFRKGEEVRTLYVVAPSGALDVRQESVSAETTPAPRPLTRREKARMAVLGIAIAAAILGLSAIFVDYRALFSSIGEAVRPFDVEKLEVNAEAFKDYFTVERKMLAPGGRNLIITLKRTKTFPLKDTDYETLAEKTTKTLHGLLPLETIARGYVRCEFFSKANEFLGFTSERIRGLAEKESIELILPIAGRSDLRRIVITY